MGCVWLTAGAVMWLEYTHSLSSVVWALLMYDHIRHLYSSSWSENNSSKTKNQGMGKLLASLYTLLRPFPILTFTSILRLFLSLLLYFFSEHYQDLGSEHF